MATHSSASTVVKQSLILPEGAISSDEPIHTHKRVIGYFDGCFDVMHSGHYNAFRSARELCDELIVGVHSEKEIEQTKGVRPVQTDEERIRLVGSCKWVDRVVLSKEYSPDYMALLERYGADFCIHGSDINYNADGKDPFAEAKKAGRFRTLERIGTISTTEIITRLLKATSPDPHEQRRTEEQEDADSYLLTTDRLCKFMNTTKHRPHVPKEGHTIVYVAGSWDLFHSGHVRLLQEAKKLGDFLLVGLHEDSSVLAHTGPGQHAGRTAASLVDENAPQPTCVFTSLRFSSLALVLPAPGMPIMSLFERAMNVLGCRDVDEVVFDAPFVITHEMCDFLGIDVVVKPSLNIDYGQTHTRTPRRPSTRVNIEQPTHTLRRASY